MIVFRCPHCGQFLQVHEPFAGKAANCPFCRTGIVVPSCPQPLPPPPAGQLPALSPMNALARAAAAPARSPFDPRYVKLKGSPARSGRTTTASWLTLLGVVALGGIVTLIGQVQDRPNWMVAGAFIIGGTLIFLIGAVPGLIAESKNLPNAAGISAMGILGILIVVLWIVALCLALAGTSAPSHAPPAAAPDRLLCPTCGESIPRAARVCRFCRQSLA